MHTFLLRAVPRVPSCTPLPHRPAQPIFACVARGAEPEAEGLVLGELHRAGWKVLEVFGPAQVREAFPGLKRHPAVGQAMVAARERGMAFLVMTSESPSGPATWTPPR